MEENMRQNIEGRLSTVEAGLARQHEDMINMSKRMVSGFESIDQKLDRVTRDHTASQRIPWNAIGVMVTIWVLSLSPLFWLAKANYTSANKMDELFTNHIKDGHPGRVNDKTVANANAIKDLDTNLQREMRLLQTNDLEAISSTDDRLQGEMRLLIEGMENAQNERFKALEQRVFKERSQ